GAKRPAAVIIVHRLGAPRITLPARPACRAGPPRFSPPVQEDRAVRFDRLAIGHAITGAETVMAFALLWLPCGPAHAQTKLTARYALSLADIAIGEGDWAVEITKDRYTAQSS